MKIFSRLGCCALLFFTLTATSCREEKMQKQDVAEIGTLDDLWVSLHKVEQDVSSGFLLQHSGPDEKIIFKKILYDLKISVLRLRKNPNDEKALARLYESFQIYKNLNMQEDDGRGTEVLSHHLKLALDSISGLQGKSLDGIARILFAKKFDEELAPFATHTRAGQEGWKKSNFHEKQFAAVSGSLMKSWLFTPRFDLKSARSPSFTISQTIMSRGAPFGGIINVWVSTDYQGGDPETASWEAIDLKRQPDGSGSASVTSESVSLEKFVGQHIVIAFLYDTLAAPSSPLWQLNSFELSGAGTFGLASLIPHMLSPSEPETQQHVLFSQSFNQPDSKLEPFTPSPSSSPWQMKSAYGKIFAMAQSQFDTLDPKKVLPVDSWLISPQFDLSQVQKPALVLTQAAKGDRLNLALQVLVSENYRGNPAEAVWKSLKIQNLPSGRDFKAVETEAIELSEWQGKAISVALRLKNPEGEEPSRMIWQLEGFRLTGLGELTVLPAVVKAKLQTTAPP